MSSRPPRCAALRRGLRDLSHRRLESRLVKHVRMQLEDRRAQLAGHIEQRLVCSGERGLVRQLEHDILEIVAGRQQRLHGTVVEAVCKGLALAVLGGEHLGQQMLALDHELYDLVGPPRDHRREHGARHANPGEHARPERHESGRVTRLVRPDVEHRLQHVGEHRDGGRDQRQPRPVSERDRNRDEHVAEPRVGERAAGECRKHGDHDDVDDERPKALPRGGAAGMRDQQHADAPREVGAEQDEERPVVVAAGR